VAYTWDATSAVAAAYAAGQPVSLAIYDSAAGRNTTKYFTSSETGDWNQAGTILFTPWADQPINRVSSEGGAIEPVTTLENAVG
jgi:hypothetical protein